MTCFISRRVPCHKKRVRSRCPSAFSLHRQVRLKPDTTYRRARRVFVLPSRLRVSEQELETELHDSRIFGRGDSSERRGVVHRRVRVVEVHRVEQVEKLRTELEALVSPEREPLEQPHVDG